MAVAANDLRRGQQSRRGDGVKSGLTIVSNSPHRSFERITTNDLARVAQIAFDDFADLCQRKEYCRRYADRLRLICLCQGAARHYVHHDRGVWDFDLWGFFSG